MAGDCIFSSFTIGCDWTTDAALNSCQDKPSKTISYHFLTQLSWSKHSPPPLHPSPIQGSKKEWLFNYKCGEKWKPSEWHHANMWILGDPLYIHNAPLPVFLAGHLVVVENGVAALGTVASVGNASWEGKVLLSSDLEQFTISQSVSQRILKHLKRILPEELPRYAIQQHKAKVQWHLKG